MALLCFPCFVFGVWTGAFKRKRARHAGEHFAELALCTAQAGELIERRWVL